MLTLSVPGVYQWLARVNGFYRMKTVIGEQIGTVVTWPAGFQWLILANLPQSPVFACALISVALHSIRQSSAQPAPSRMRWAEVHSPPGKRR